MPELFECWNIPFIADTRSHCTMSCGNWNSLIRKWTPPNIKDGAYKLIQNRFYTALTSWYVSKRREDGETGRPAD